MPTFGWVQETAWDRFLSAIDAPPEPIAVRPPTFQCPFCGATYKKSADLQDHLGSSHHVARPVMLIAGIEPTDSFVLRRAPRASDIDFVNTTSATLAIDNEPSRIIAASDIWQMLATTTNGRVRIRIENAPARKLPPANWQAVTKSSDRIFSSSTDASPEPVETSYDINVRIASASELLATERAFDKHLNVTDLTRDSVSAFLADPRCKGVAEDYATGMAEYALGVLVKEGRHDPGLESPLARYREHFGSAIIRFEPHKRPLPRLLSAFMRFSLNDFSHAGEGTGHFGLDRATAALADPAGGTRATARPEAGTLRHVCPIDHGTDRVLRLAEDLFSAKRWSPVLADECRQVASASTLDLTDQVKATALWALAALQLGATRDAIEPLQRIAATYPFNEWASSTLDAVTA